MSIKFFHRYLGLVLCIVMLSISSTGVILVWKKEFLWLTVEGAREVVDIRLLATTIPAIEKSYGKNEVRLIQLYSEDLSIHKVFLSGRRYAWHNQYGDRVQVWSGNERWEDFVLDLHHRFLLGNTIGLNIAGFGGLLLLPLIVFGCVMWWPRRRLLIAGLWPASTVRGALMRSHSNIGALFALPILMLAITGVILVYPTESKVFLLESVGLESATISNTEVLGISPDSLEWQHIIEIAREQFPEARIRSVQPMLEKTESRSINLQQKDGWHRLGRTSLTFHANGELTIVDELKQARAGRVFGFSYPLHTAKLGLLYRLLVTFVGIAFILMIIFGFGSYLKRNQ